ncbi:MAG: hypothetical protein IKE76_05060 [Clostridia bacterium]|nr:hypothetical protein [Clostridia bacterium]
MYLVITQTDSGGSITYKEYRSLRNLSFSPEADLIAQSLPVNQFSCDIITGDDVGMGENAELYDDMDNLFASYWVASAYHPDPKTLRITAKSLFALMENAGELPAEMFASKSAADAILDCIKAPGSRFGAGNLSIDSSLAGATLDGFVPQQNARERLLWILFALGAWAKTAFNNVVEILPIDDTETLIPVGRTFWQPSATETDIVTALRVKAWSFTLIQPTTETAVRYVTERDPRTGRMRRRMITEIKTVQSQQVDSTALTDGTNYWTAEAQTVELANSAAPAAAPENVVEFSDVYLVNGNNASAILTRLASRYFKPTVVEADVINNADYAPGDKVAVHAGGGAIYSGFIEREDFSFGVQARSRLTLTACEKLDTAKLVVLCMYGETQIDRQEYVFPVGYAYSVDMLFIDWTMSRHRYIFRPTQATLTGTMPAGGAEMEVEYAVALDLYKGVLSIYNVDDITTVTEDGVVVGVIS